MEEWQADDMLGEIKALQDDRNRFEKIAKAKIDNIQLDLTKKSESIDKEVQFMKDQLAAFFLTVEKKETKTQQSYSLLSGKLVMKRATQRIVHDDEKLLKWMQQYSLDGEYIKQTTISKVDWSALKKDIDINCGSIVMKSTGEVLEGIDGITVEEVAPQFDIK